MTAFIGISVFVGGLPPSSGQKLRLCEKKNKKFKIIYYLKTMWSVN